MEISKYFVSLNLSEFIFILLRELKKLETLVEENDDHQEQNDVHQIPRVNENIIKLLLDEAKNEGLYHFVESNRTPSGIFIIEFFFLILFPVSNSVHSFYDEALDILREREKNLKNQNDHSNLNIQEPSLDLENQKLINENLSDEIEHLSSRSSNKSSYQFLNEDKDSERILPPLISRNDSVEINRDDSRLSVNSSGSTRNSTLFPKINNRYLPK